jgi:hypothetical protein
MISVFTHDLTATLEKFKISEPARGEAMAFIASLEPEVVEK